MAVRLLRGSLVMPAHVAWSTERRCGLRFSSLVCVDDWLAPPGRQEQQRVDDVVRVVKAGAVPFAAPQQSSTVGMRKERAPAELAEALLKVSQLVERLGENLASDDAILARHGDQLIDLDIALQTIRAVAGLLTSQENGPAMLSRLENLRKSYAQALCR